MDIRNIAIIAHVDHGKTTLVDALLKQSEDFKLRADENQELIMDSNDLERERGITIFSKNAAIRYKGGKINIVDTPGHADFGGEVERIMRMVDGVLLLVDAQEGPMPQTKFVLKKAIEAGHKAIVVINKIDKPAARVAWVLDEVFSLFIDLGASEEQAHFPVIYASGVQGKAGLEPDLTKMTDVQPLFTLIEKEIAPAQADRTAPLQMLTVNLAYDNYKGRIAIGRLYGGILKAGQKVAHIKRDGAVGKAQIGNVMSFEGLARVDVTEAVAGDIVAISGIEDISIGETIADSENPIALPPIHIEEPTIKSVFGVNKSPFAGQEGDMVTSRNLKERLERELATDVALRVESTESPDQWIVAGRGELHLAILIEKMRREGYELQVAKPQVIFKEETRSTGSGQATQTLEPIEMVNIEVPNESAGAVIQDLGSRLGQMRDMKQDGPTTRLEFLIPTRGLIGYRTEFITRTKGLGIMNSLFYAYEPMKGEMSKVDHGSLIAHQTGKSTTYGLMQAQDRGQLFIGPAVPIYAGMVVGRNAKAQDMAVHVGREKAMSNMRSKGEGAMEFLDTPLEMSLEYALEYISDDELVEVTPESIRIRKKDLRVK
ncbi:MAG: translational GTPase TypA [Candidatus Harrisonbacteria bacterium CG10_big_fil_rev_8_21_14_0_10_49_15]|uniref:50S ribosomal subunit assembly factor BipA n=1 Tax=Candidatus Harrisonbacteria bacterium CG10_big_fil_rev_8_21_14_0_10_49_15 TaxID=1974587 RepID=A0A2H0UL54_9BACT|nr:MAG: translational GTPase TypA [Candidatus Harrisonbacteria bacterium CG10_big_fil_rev_8_21_14_0_10_49_15]